MFRRYPYWGWLLLCFLLWGVVGYYYHTHRQALLPERMARAVNNNIHTQEALFNELVNNQKTVNDFFTDSLSLQDVQRITEMPFYIFAYENNYLKFWNSNAILPFAADIGEGKPHVVRNEKGVFIQKSFHVGSGSKIVVVLFPVLLTYPVENDYLKSRFVASPYIPVSTGIITSGERSVGAYPVSMLDKSPAFHLLFNVQDIQKWVPDNLFLILLIASLLISVSWVHLMIIYLTRNKSSLVGFAITFSVILTLRVYLYIFGVPFNLDTLLFFSPRLYASSTYLSSFGDLFINTLCILWLIIFITRHTPYKSYFDRIRHGRFSKWLPILLAAAMVGYLLVFVQLVRSLILDSSISFDVSRFYSIDIYTVLGLLVICTVTGISCMVIYIINHQLDQLTASNAAKYRIVLITGVLFLLAGGFYADIFYWCLFGWLFFFLVLLDIPRLSLVSDIFEPQMIFWALFIGGFCTGLLQYFNAHKERDARKAFVEQRLAPHRDNVLEYTFDKTVRNIEHDGSLKDYFYKPSSGARKIIDKQFDTLYLNGAANRYEATIYLFDAEGNALYNEDSTDIASLEYVKTQSTPTNSPYLFYKEAIPDKNAYLSFIPIYSDTVNNKIGYVLIDLNQKKQAAETVYPELLLPASGKADPRENEYAYATYINGKLTSQKKEYPFTTYLKNDTLKDQEFRFYEVNNTSELHYKISDKRTIVVVHDHNSILEAITMFSYIFSIQVALAIIILLYQLYLSYFARPDAPGSKYIRLTLRKRIQYAMLTIVFVSFVFIGVVTIWFFTSRYRASNANKLQSSMQTARQSVQDFLNKARAYENDYMFDSVTQSAGFKTLLYTIANSQKIDINLFDNNGNLFAASQDEIYQKGLVSRIMRQDAYYQLNMSGKSIVIQNEQVAGLSYLSAYEPLRDENGVTLGYLNVPFFSSEKDLNFQISNIVVTLINVYAFIFLISSLITVWITRWVTGSFNVIIRQFGRLNLQQNERILWPYNDEIGLLVAEYNKMVNKVEENAALLAQSERETAWREMARQVAHEIKNPLTPMKLNIQHLQQAIKNDHPNIKELSLKVSASIIEQIDNLSYIASEFSNFAKMPEARPEELVLGEILYLATELYKNEQDIKLSLSVPTTRIAVFSDHSQILRVLTNLLENAKQALPPYGGIINVSLVADNGHATITIADNGHGINEEVAQKIFQPYFTTKSSGTGLGLAMTKKIIEFWKGEIWFESAGNVGTTFFIRLPLLHTDTDSQKQG